MKKWMILSAIGILLALYGIFLGVWFTRAPQPVTEETTHPTTEVTTVATTEAMTEATTQPETLPAVIYPLTDSHAFVYDCTENVLLFTQGDQAQPIAPASLTKLLTACVALQYLRESDLVTVGDEVSLVAEGSSLAAVTEGVTLTVDTLLQGMFLQSGNDAAYALAAAAGRVIDPTADTGCAAVNAFMTRVNETAAQLGLSGTHFTVPDGMDAQDHYTTAADLLTMALLAMKEPAIARYCAMPQSHVTYESGEDYIYRNTNALLDPESEYYCPQAKGLKTGTTKKAGSCLIALFDTGEKELLIGILGCPEKPDRYADALLLYENYK